MNNTIIFILGVLLGIFITCLTILIFVYVNYKISHKRMKKEFKEYLEWDRFDLF